jgi:hypothetical protein
LFSYFKYKQATIVGQCSDWMSFIGTVLNNPFIAQNSIHWSKFTIGYNIYNFASRDYLANYTSSCSDKAAVKSIVNALLSGQDANVHCGRNTRYSVFFCDSKPIVCVGCVPTCINYKPKTPNLAYQLNPCDQNFYRTAHSSFLIAEYESVIYYPLITSAVATVVVSDSELDISFNITGLGAAYCVATMNTAATGSFVRQYGTKYASTVINSTVSIKIGGLQPSTNYSVFCYTEDYLGHFMSDGQVAATVRHISTKCCKRIIFSRLQRVLVAATSFSATGNDPVYSLQLVGSASVPVAISVTFANVSCSTSSENISSVVSFLSDTSSVRVLPSLFAITATMSAYADRTYSFVVKARDPGCYMISAEDKSGIYQPVRSIVIVGSNTTVPPPYLLNAVIANSGLTMSIQFSASTDAASTVVKGSTFACNLLFVFQDARLSKCWFANSTVVIASITSSRIETGGSIMLRPGNLRSSLCTGSRVCSYANATNTTLTGPSSGVVPVVSLQSLRAIGSCDSILLDPTSSYGNGGRAWKKVAWTVAAAGCSNCSSSVGLLQSYLNANFARNSDAIVSIPNAYVIAGTSYTFVVSLTNFLGLASSGAAQITVLDSKLNVGVRIVSSLAQPVLRSHALSFVAVSAVSSCTASVNYAVNYAWMVYSGMSFQASLSSVSSNRNRFTVASNALVAGVSYTVYVYATLQLYNSRGTVNSTATASASMSFQVGFAGINVAISGGSNRLIYSGATSFIDASSSVDLDSPSTALRYLWECTEVSPNYGTMHALESRTAHMPVLQLDDLFYASLANSSQTNRSRTFSFTVTVYNVQNQSASSSVTVAIVDYRVPVLSFATQASSASMFSFDKGSNIILSGIIAADIPADVAWTSTTIVLKDASLTPPSKPVSSGIQIFTLALDPGYVENGITYSLELSACYPSSYGGCAYAQVSIVVNSPPSGGQLIVAPTRGSAANTSFSWKTLAWADDPSDYPLSYVFSYYSQTPSQQFILMSRSVITALKATLGQGLRIRQYNISCVVQAYDANNASSSTSITVQVLPNGYSTSQLIGLASAKLTTAFETRDIDSVIQVVGAMAGAVTAVNCTVPITCISINRVDCSNIPNTCGECLSGYIGASGPSNLPCSNATNLYSVGESCSSDVDCVFAKCDDGICADVRKSCPNDCLDSGICRHFDSWNNLVDECYSTESYCSAKCVCHSGASGLDCGVTDNDLTAARDSRDLLCSSIYKTVSRQDVVTDTVIARASLISQLLFDPTLLTEAALENCTLALVETIVDNPSIASQLSVATGSLQSLSGLLGASLDQALMDEVDAAISVLVTGMQSYLAADMAPTKLVTGNIETSVSVVSLQYLANSTFSPPQPSLYEYLAQPVDAVAVEATGSDQLGVSLVQVGVSNLERTDSLPLSLRIDGSKVPSAVASQLAHFQAVYQAVYSPIAPNSRSRRLQQGVSTVAASATVVLYNSAPITYVNATSYNTTFVCEKSSVPYNATIICSEDFAYNLTCPASHGGHFVVTCPHVTSFPLCFEPDAYGGYERSDRCTVVEYDSEQTVCQCVLSNSSSSQSITLVSSSHLNMRQIFLTFVQNPAVQEVSLAAVGIMIAFVLLFLIGLGMSYHFEAGSNKKHIQYAVQEKETVRGAVEDSVLSLPLRSLMAMAVPAHLSRQHWRNKYYAQLLRFHDIFYTVRMIISQRSHPHQAIVRLTGVTARLLPLIVVNTVVNYCLLSNGGLCSKFNDPLTDLCSTSDHLAVCDWEHMLHCDQKQRAGYIALFLRLTIIAALSFTVQNVLGRMNAVFGMMMDSNLLVQYGLRSSAGRYFLTSSYTNDLASGDGSISDIVGLQNYRNTMLKAAAVTKYEAMKVHSSLEVQALNQAMVANEW